MSDGPYKSLKSQRWWKKFAKVLEMDVSSSTEIKQTLEQAIRQDFKNEIPPNLIKDFKSLFKIPSNHQINMFSDKKSEFILLEKLQINYSGYPLVETAIGFAQQALAENKVGDEAIISILSKTIYEQVGRKHRQITEHYLREDNSCNAQKVIRRSAQAIQTLDCKKNAMFLLSNEKQSKPIKYNGLEDGVPL
ncbi:MAG: hypothetical protein WAQ53_12545 [Thiofilum sp.]|uniref:hypothetical protein n=1 Tax=Thiofilum sp. TaxID=2212733 RepID=UPI0025CEB62A|nr:hypothetical protein [Thiofilum sp.]MBK8454349.1 hypothetical protein [Thiofilum sp.]